MFFLGAADPTLARADPLPQFLPKGAQMKLLFRLLTLLFFTFTTLSANAQAPILTADAAILMDARTGNVLY